MQADEYPRWGEWSDADQVDIGRCPDPIPGIHGDDPRQVYADLCETVDEVIGHIQNEGRERPKPAARPMREVV